MEASGGWRPRIDARAVADKVELPDLAGKFNVNLSRHGKEYEALCPFHNERTPSFRVFNKGAGWRYHCFGCGADGDSISFYMHMAKVDFVEALERLAEDEGLVDPVAAERASQTAKERRAAVEEKDARDRAERTARAREIWKSCRPADGTLVETYLRSRAIKPELQGGIPVTLRYHPALKHPDTGLLLPAMVAAVQNTEGRIVGIHRTYLKADGRGKAEVSKAKMMLGPCWGAAVRFDPIGPRLCMGEGIETTKSVRQALREAEDPMPCWAALSLGNMGAVLLPNGVRELILLSDADAKDAAKAEQALRKAADQQRKRGLLVKVARPEPGTDFNNMLQRAG